MTGGPAGAAKGERRTERVIVMSAPPTEAVTAVPPAAPRPAAWTFTAPPAALAAGPAAVVAAATEKVTVAARRDARARAFPESETPRWIEVLAGAPVRTAFTPVAFLTALLVHHFVPNEQSPLPTRYYPGVLLAALAALPLVTIAGSFIGPVGRWLRHNGPVIGGAALVCCAWDLLTLKFAVMPLPYFPGPDEVLVSLAEDWRELLDAARHSLTLLGMGYAAGALLGVVSGVMLGWFRYVRYWGMPAMKLIGPIPATAWMPLAIMVLPVGFSGVGLIALAVWFPVTMLTSSGIANVRTSHLEVARTLGAGRSFMIFRVALPSAMPHIFIGLFIGLCASFLTLIVAEMMGVKSGLGWYVSWAQGWAEYGKMYAALLICALVFSTLITLLFRLRDKVLVWQKGMIRW